MTSRSLYVVAAFAAGLGAATSAEALAPLSMDASAEPRPAGPSPFAQSAPAEWKRYDAATFEPNPTVQRRATRLQCVPFARTEGHVEIYGDANTWWAQARGRYARSRKPEEGAVMVMRGYAGAARGHVAVIREMITDRMMLVDHANWMNRGEVTRAVPVRDVSARGDWSQVQVWHVTGAHWGGRTYNVQGFILDHAPTEAANDNSTHAEVADAAQTPVG